MSRAFKRKITVFEEDYFWVLNGNSIYQNKQQYIRIHSKRVTKRILYLDPYNWYFEIRPKVIREAIVFAIENGWNPDEKGEPLLLSMNGEKGFQVLS